MVNIILSPSQQSANRCVIGDSEEDHCFKIAKLTYDLLRDYECNVLLIPKELSTLQEVVNMSNDFVRKNQGVPSFHLDIHTDAGYDGKGCSGFYISENGRQFISIIQQEIAKVTPWVDSGVKKRSDLHVLEHTLAYAGLIELSFHDRIVEAKHIHENMGLYAQGLVNGFVRACGLSKKQHKEHWAETHWQFLTDRGLLINEKRFDDPITRGEMLALLANVYAHLDS